MVEDLFFDSPAPSGRHRNDRVQLRLFRHHNTVGMKRVVFFHHPTYQDKWRLWEWFLAPLIAHVPVAFMTGPNHYGRVEPDDFPGEWTVNPNVHTLYRSIRQWCWDQQAAVNLLRERFGLEPAAISGFSVGAFQSILLAGLGGMDLPIVAIACTNRYAFGLLHGVIGPPVIKAMGRAGVTPAILEEMAESMQLERYAPALRGRNILMIRGLFDEVDPPPSLQRLEEALRPSRILRIPTGHGTLVFLRKAVMDETLLFLEQLGILALSQPSGRPPASPFGLLRSPATPGTSPYLELPPECLSRSGCWGRGSCGIGSRAPRTSRAGFPAPFSRLWPRWRHLQLRGI